MKDYKEVGENREGQISDMKEKQQVPRQESSFPKKELQA